jgi:hypothetical protein
MSKRNVHRETTGFALLQKLPVGEWLFCDFIIPVGLEPFYEWVREFVSSGYKEELLSVDGTKRIHIWSATYSRPGYVGVGTFQVWPDAIYHVPDSILFVFSTKTSDDKYKISGVCDPIIISYFIKMLTAVAQEWPDAAQAVQEYLTRLHRMADALLPKTRGQRGRRSEFNQEERDRVVEKWEAQKRAEDARDLGVFLVDEFGEKDDASLGPSPIVSKSTFYNWRRDYLKRKNKRSKP